MPTPVQVRVTQWSPGIKPTWTIAEVRRALRAHADGDFQLSALLVDAMGEDDELAGLLEKRVGGVLGSDFRLEAVDAPDRQFSKQLVRRYGPAWWTIFPEGELHEFLSWRRMLGVSIGVLDWKHESTSWVPRFRCLHPQYLRYDLHRREWRYNAQEGDLLVTPGNGTWILSCDGQRGWMRCGVRALAVTWLFKQFTLRDWNRYNERHGLPIIKAKAPAIADDDDTERFFEDAQALDREVVALLPTHLNEEGAAFDLELLEAKDQSWQSFERSIDRCDRRFTVYLLGANLSTEVNREGARSTAEVHRGVERQKATTDAKTLANELREQGLWPIVALNHAGASLDVIPWPQWDTSPPSDDKAEAESKKAFGEAIQAIDRAGFEVENVEELAEQYGLRLKKKPEPPTGNPGVVPPAQEGAPGHAPATSGLTQNFGARLASGALAAKNTGFINGQLYADEVAEHALVSAQARLDDIHAAIREELDAASSYADFRARMAARYADLDPEELSTIVFAAMAMVELAGRAAVNEDL